MEVDSLDCSTTKSGYNLDTLNGLAKTCFGELNEHRWILNRNVFEGYLLKNKSNELCNLINKEHNDIRDKHIIESDLLTTINIEYVGNCKQHMKEKVTWLNESFPYARESYAQKIIVPLGSKICLIGDIHGSIHSLLRILLSLKRKSLVNNNFEIVSDSFYIVFTGDYVDRGLYGAEVWYTILKLINKNRNKVFLLRGNHETLEQNIYQGTPNSLFSDFFKFEWELRLKYSQYQATKMLEDFCKLYNFLPSDLFIGSGCEDNISWVQCCHGGFPRMVLKPLEVTSGTSAPILHNPKSFLKSLCSFERIGYLDWFDSIWLDFVQKKDGSIVMTNKLRGDHKKSDYEETITDDSFLRRGVKAIFRGHQHNGASLKMFEEGGAERAFDNMPPVDWKGVVSNGERMAGKFRISDYCPIFTLSTATEFGITDCASYTILTTAENFEDWTLEPYELYLPSEEVVNDSSSLTNLALQSLRADDVVSSFENLSLDE